MYIIKKLQCAKFDDNLVDSNIKEILIEKKCLLTFREFSLRKF